MRFDVSVTFFGVVMAGGYAWNTLQYYLVKTEIRHLYYMANLPCVDPLSCVFHLHYIFTLIAKSESSDRITHVLAVNHIPHRSCHYIFVDWLQFPVINETVHIFRLAMGNMDLYYVITVIP